MIDYPDFSEWLLEPGRFEHELEGWKKDHLYEEYAKLVDRFRIDLKLDSILEFGCGAGFVPACLKVPYPRRYVGLDKNKLCLKQASEFTVLPSWLEFVEGDIRTVGEWNFDLVCSFAVIKHFSLPEFFPIVYKFLSMGRYALFSMQLGEEDLDDGQEAQYHHIWVSRETLNEAIKRGGHRILWSELRWEGTHHGTTGQDWYFFTERKNPW